MPRLRALLAAVACAAGCSSDPDVVAVGTTANDAGQSGLSALDTIEGCEAGLYVGTFVGSYGGNNIIIDVSGTIQFELILSLNREFLTIGNARLLGVTTETGVEFSADVESDTTNGCREGAISSRLVNGRIAGGQLHFTGTVEGTYNPDSREFLGTWETNDETTGTVTGFGEWNAFHGLE